MWQVTILPLFYLFEIKLIMLLVALHGLFVGYGIGHIVIASMSLTTIMLSFWQSIWIIMCVCACMYVMDRCDKFVLCPSLGHSWIAQIIERNSILVFDIIFSPLPVPHPQHEVHHMLQELDITNLETMFKQISAMTNLPEEDKRITIKRKKEKGRDTERGHKSRKK